MPEITLCQCEGFKLWYESRLRAERITPVCVCGHSDLDHLDGTRACVGVVGKREGLKSMILADPLELAAAIRKAADEFPGCKLEKNQVGNLNVVVFRPAAEYVGWIDLAFPALNYYSEDDQ